MHFSVSRLAFPARAAMIALALALANLAVAASAAALPPATQFF
ncbi:hypothetical protein [Massilia sp. TSP1-1-2]